MQCARCNKKLNTSDRRRRYCSDECRNRKPVARHLRAVEPGEVSSALSPRQLAVDVAATEGTDLELLMAMRDRVARQVADPNCPARDLASLTRRLEEIRKQIQAERLRLKEELKDAEHVPDEAWSAEAL